SRGNAATSEVLVSHFRGSVAEARMPLFRELLKRVARLERRAAGDRGGKEWVLKAEFGGEPAAGGADA
ncbi:hypothetical protein MNEG_7591, partial [Monoraphidium neglectum]